MKSIFSVSCAFALLLVSSSAFSPYYRPRLPTQTAATLVGASYEAPSDYDRDDLEPTKKEVSVTYDDDDEEIRDALKRELLLLSSVTSRGEYASSEERDIVIDIVTQLGELAVYCKRNGKTLLNVRI